MSRSDREGVGHFPLSVISTNKNKQKRADAYTSALSSGGNWWGDISLISKQLQNAAGGGCPFRPQIPSNIYFHPIMTKLACQFFLYAITLDFPFGIRYDIIRIIPGRRNLLNGDKEAGALYSRRKL
ncbi:hypothetical protein [Butyricicoccus sp.]|uniref:hypothetical protein n=1 Tax=Butyricicoccus sp. TaxID=2049021 RepID=UPI003D7CEE2F